MLISFLKKLLLLIPFLGLPVLVHAYPPCVFPDNIIYVDISASGVGDGSSWDDAFTSLQDAIEASCNCGTATVIWAAQGTYYPDIGASQSDDDRNSVFTICSGTELYGGFNGTESDFADRNFSLYPTVLSGDLQQDDGLGMAGNTDNAYRIIFLNYVNSQTRIDGFTIRGANGEGNNGGGIYNNGSGNGNQSNPQIVNCQFIGNVARSGAAIFNDGRQGESSPTLINCVFRGNLATRDGGVLYNFGGFSGNSSPVLINCLLSGNRAYRIGGAIYNDAVDAVDGTSSSTLINCTLTGNKGDFGTGAIYSNGGTTGVSNSTLTNCILWGNSSEIGTDNATTTVNHSIVQGDYPGINNLDIDPLFITPIDQVNAPDEAGDFHLQFSSPAINAGDDNVVSVPPFPEDNIGNPLDLEGSLRIQLSSVDMGAYELACEASAGELTNSNSSSTLFICKPANAQFTFGMVGQAGGPGYTYAFFLTNADGQILETSLDGNFALETLPNGVYTVYGLSYAIFNTPTGIQNYLSGKTLANIQSDGNSDQFCLELGEVAQAGQTNRIMIQLSGCGNYPWSGN